MNTTTHNDPIRHAIEVSTHATYSDFFRPLADATTYEVMDMALDLAAVISIQPEGVGKEYLEEHFRSLLRFLGKLKH